MRPHHTPSTRLSRRTGTCTRSLPWLAGFGLLMSCTDWTATEPDPIGRLSVQAAAIEGPQPLGVVQSLPITVTHSGQLPAELIVTAVELVDASGAVLASAVPDPAAEPVSSGELQDGAYVVVDVDWVVTDPAGAAIELRFESPDGWLPASRLEVPVTVTEDYDQDGLLSLLAGGDDCDDTDASVSPAADEVWYDGVDQDCDGNDSDQDEDGFDAEAIGGEDCDDTEPDAFPGNTEVWYDGIDQDCDGNDSDQDGDLFDATEVGGPDCDDLDPAVLPGAPDGGSVAVDDDCDGLIDEDGLSAGDVLIVETLRETGDADPAGMWFEVVAPTATTAYLSGWTVETDRESGVLVAIDGGPLPSPPGEPVVVCASVDPAREVPCDATIEPPLSPNAVADRLVLSAGDLQVHAIRWDRSWPGEPGVSDYVPWEPDGPPSEASLWCASTDPWDTAGTGDLGSPGAPNPTSCITGVTP